MEKKKSLSSFFSFSFSSPFLLLLLLSTGEVRGWHEMAHECSSFPLSDFGEKAKEREEINLFVYNEGTGVLPCQGKREDWREMFPRCLQSMTSLDTYSYAKGPDGGECSSCSTLKNISCSEVFSKKVAAIVSVGGGSGLHLHCKRLDPVSNDSPDSALLVPPVCLFDETRHLDPRMNGANLKDAIRLMVPIVALRVINWGNLYGAQIYGTEIPTLEEQKTIKENEENERAKDEMEKEEGEKSGGSGWWQWSETEIQKRFKARKSEREGKRLWEGEKWAGGQKERYPWVVVGDHVLSKIMKIKRREEEEWWGETMPVGDLIGKGWWGEGNRVGKREWWEKVGATGQKERMLVGEWWVNGTKVGGWKRTKVGVVKVGGRGEWVNRTKVVWEEVVEGRRGDEEEIEVRRKELEESVREGKGKSGDVSIFERELAMIDALIKESGKEKHEKGKDNKKIKEEEKKLKSLVEKEIGKDREREKKDRQKKLMLTANKKEREKRWKGEWEQGKHIFLYISRIDNGKGQSAFIDKLIKEKKYFIDNNLHIRFVASLESRKKEVSDMKEALTRAKKAGIIPEVMTMDTHQYSKTHLEELLSYARGLVHYAENDRNPRIIAEALVARLPVISTIQTSPFVGLECVPPSIAVIADQNPPDLAQKKKVGELERVFGKFMKGTKNQSLVREHMDAIFDGFQITKVYPEICRKMGLCKQRDPPKTVTPQNTKKKSSFKLPGTDWLFNHSGLIFPPSPPPSPPPADEREFWEVMKKGGVVETGYGVFGKGLEGLECKNTDFNLCVRWATCFQYQRKNFRHLYLEDFTSVFSKKDCYTEKGLKLFMRVIGNSAKMRTSRTLAELPSRKDL